MPSFLSTAFDNVADHTFNTSEDIAPFQTHIVDVHNDGYGDVVRGGCKCNNSQGQRYLWYGPFYNTTSITFTWDTTNTSPGKYILKASIAPAVGEEDIEDNTTTATIEVKEER